MRLSPHEHQKLKELAVLTHRSKSEVVRLLISLAVPGPRGMIRLRDEPEREKLPGV